THHGVLMEVALLHAAVLHRDLLAHQLAHPVDDRALSHVLRHVGVDDLAAYVRRHPDFVHLHLFVGNGDFGYFGEVTLMAEVEGYAHRRTLGQIALAPV